MNQHSVCIKTNNDKTTYNKYIKYKLKYLKLKKLIGLGESNPRKKFKKSQELDQQTLDQQIEPNKKQKKTLSNNDLFILFISSKLLEKQTTPIFHNLIINQTDPTLKTQPIQSIQPIQPIQQRDRKPPKRYRDYESELTPIIKQHIESKYYDVEDIESLRAIINKSLESDTELITNAMLNVNLLDDEYKQYENYGKLVECFIADHMKCPCCEQLSLKRYSSDVMPAIDLVCVNPEHKFSHGVKFYQVKASNGALFKGQPYFSKTAQTIHVGSINQGQLIHSIKISDDDFTKKILIGYICIEYTEKENTLQINSHKSFIVCPRYDILNKKLFMSDNMDINNIELDKISTNSTDLEFGQLYYKYNQEQAGPIIQPHPIIKFSKINNHIKKINDYILIKTIPKTYLETNKWSQIDNPLKDIIL